MWTFEGRIKDFSELRGRAAIWGRPYGDSELNRYKEGSYGRFLRAGGHLGRPYGDSVMNLHKEGSYGRFSRAGGHTGPPLR